jgi:hypothetical protein
VGPKLQRRRFGDAGRQPAVLPHSAELLQNSQRHFKAHIFLPISVAGEVEGRRETKEGERNAGAETMKRKKTTQSSRQDRLLASFTRP